MLSEEIIVRNWLTGFKSKPDVHPWDVIGDSYKLTLNFPLLWYDIFADASNSSESNSISLLTFDRVLRQRL